MSKRFTFSWLLSLRCHIASAVCLRNVCSSDFQELQCLDTCAACSVIMNTKCAAIFWARFSSSPPPPLNWVASSPQRVWIKGCSSLPREQVSYLKVAALEMLAYVQWEQNFDEAGESLISSMLLFSTFHIISMKARASWGPARRLNAPNVILPAPPTPTPWALHRCYWLDWL